MIWIVISFMAGALTSYLVLRKNPKIKAYVDKISEQIKGKLG